jgi:hypothetical protein
MPAAAADTASATGAAVQVAVAAQAELSVGTLDTQVAEALWFMRKRKKLAHDVYLVLYDQWRLRTFANVARSEQTHTDAVASLLARYGLADPAADLPAGQFANADLQALYDQLVATGSQSLGDALRVGAAIEEIDILDLQERMAQTDGHDIRTSVPDPSRLRRDGERCGNAPLGVAQGASRPIETCVPSQSPKQRAPPSGGARFAVWHGRRSKSSSLLLGPQVQ